MTSATKETANEIKDKGNVCVRNGNFEEAIIHYSCVIKLEPTNYSAYSNRSLAFLKLQQYYLAMEDALKTISLRPDWAKGYFRKAEVELATFHFSNALISYSKALQLQPDDLYIIESLKKAGQQQKKDKKADEQIPWLGAGIGLILGVIIVIADFVFTNKPTLHHPILMALLTITVSMIGYGIARAFRYYVKCQREGLLLAPISLQDDNEIVPETSNQNSTEGISEKTNTPRYTKAQARQRFRKGKL